MKDQEHAAKVAQKLKEDEDVQAALRMQDEIMARRMQETEAKRWVESDLWLGPLMCQHK